MTPKEQRKRINRIKAFTKEEKAALGTLIDNGFSVIAHVPKYGTTSFINNHYDTLAIIDYVKLMITTEDIIRELRSEKVARENLEISQEHEEENNGKQGYFG